ncbi:MAG: hypothetical protein H6747_10860 [Deltaproteobacteria bacterium]|nr:hypothetical protein [Deltaproteobacteria bacterium]
MSIRAGNKAEGDAFFNRDREQEDFWRLISDNHVVLSGPRRLGKTSLLQRLADTSEGQGWLAKLVDVQDVTDVAGFLDALDRAIPERTLWAWLKRQGDRTRAHLGRVRKVEVKAPDELGGAAAAVELAALPATTWRERAEKLRIRLTKVPLLLLVDEFSVFLERLVTHDRDGAAVFLGWLRAWRLSDEVECRFVFSGSIGLGALLERHDLETVFNDCYDFQLRPFSQRHALNMLRDELEAEHWEHESGLLKFVCQRCGWLSPFYLNSLLLEATRVALDRMDELGDDRRLLTRDDVDGGYERLLQGRSRFSHWHKRLRRDLEPAEFEVAELVLAAICGSDEPLKRQHLLNRVRHASRGVEEPAFLLDRALIKLVEDGYVGLASDGYGFLSFLLRDYWKRNHA